MHQRDQYGRAPLPEERRIRILDRLNERGTVSVAELETEFNISAMTARRDLDALEQDGKVRRTHGGAVLPTLAADEDSFEKRLTRARPAKEKLAIAAADLVSPGASIFLDSSTTAFFVAKRLVEVGLPLTVLTNSVATMDLLASADRPGVQLVGLGGSLRRLTRSYVGPLTVHATTAHVADITFLSVKGVTTMGKLTDPDPLEAEVKRAMVQHCRRAVLMIDGSKLDHSGVCVVADLSQVSMVLTADISEGALSAIPIGNAEVKYL
jgi:DeoR/GlpR family transcriptional regulator of sugar metabolism